MIASVLGRGLRELRETAGCVADLVLPRPCPGCGGIGPWCAGCAVVLQARPREPVLSESTVDTLAEYGPLPVVRALARYSGPIRAVVIAGKERGRRDLPPILGAALGDGLLRLFRLGLVAEHPVLVPAPTRPAAARARGGDPVHRMVRAAAAVLAREGLLATVAPVLVTGRGARDSVHLDAQARTANLTGRVRLRLPVPGPPGSAVVLVDDVLTTGATLVASVAALAAAGTPVSLVLTVAAVPPWRQVR